MQTDSLYVHASQGTREMDEPATKSMNVSTHLKTTATSMLSVRTQLVHTNVLVTMDLWVMAGSVLMSMNAVVHLVMQMLIVPTQLEVIYATVRLVTLVMELLV
jgi:hypothetical protein